MNQTTFYFEGWSKCSQMSYMLTNEFFTYIHICLFKQALHFRNTLNEELTSVSQQTQACATLLHLGEHSCQLINY